MGEWQQEDSKKFQWGQRFYADSRLAVGELEKDEIELMATIVRKIWLRRNTVVFGVEFTHPSQLIQSAKKVVLNFNVAVQNKSTHGNQVRNIEVPKWMAPPYDVIKVNWDW